MGYTRLFLHDLTDAHLTQLMDVIGFAVDTTLENWLGDIREGDVEVYDLGDGIIGLRPGDKKLVVEFISGDGLVKRGPEIVAWLRERAWNRDVEMWTPRGGMVKVAEACGFRPLATWMRLS